MSPSKHHHLSVIQAFTEGEHKPSTAKDILGRKVPKAPQAGQVTESA